MFVVTSEHVTGHRITDTKGQVFGVVVRSRGLGGNIMAGLRSLVGGEIKEYTELLEEARRHAVDRMVESASAMGANAIIMMRFDSSEIGQTMSEIVAYGTAARVARSAIAQARAEGIKVGLFRPITLWPFPEPQLRELGNQVWGALVVELSAGQMVEDVRLAIEGRCPVTFLGRTGGMVPTPGEVVAQIRSLAARTLKGQPA